LGNRSSKRILRFSYFYVFVQQKKEVGILPIAQKSQIPQSTAGLPGTRYVAVAG